MSLASLFLWSSLALAGPQEDLVLASDMSQNRTQRMDAFFRLVRYTSSDLNFVLEVAQNEQANMDQRWVAIRVLGRSEGRVANRALVDLLGNSQAPVRAAAMEALGDQGDREQAVLLLPGLSDPAIVVRVSAAIALAELRNPVAVDALDKALQDESNYRAGQSLWVRRYYVMALGAIGSDDAYPALLRGLDDSDDRVVEESMTALEKVAGFSYAEGRDWEEQRQAWRRWAQSRIQ